MAVGQGSFVIGILLTFLCRYLEKTGMEFGFTLGLLNGLAGTLFGLSVVMNVQSIRFSRQK